MRLLAIGVLAACSRHEPPPPTPPPQVSSEGGSPDAAAACAATETVPGFVVERWPIGATPIAAAPCIDVVRGDLGANALCLYTDPAGRTADAWRDREHLTAVINAGMFHEGGAPVGLIVDRGRTLGEDNPKFGGVLAWDPVDPHDPAVTITAKQCAGFDLTALRKRYRSLIQSYRLLDCDGRALPWKDPKQYSSAAIGVDRAGRIVLLHARGAVTMAELSVALAGHDLAGALFLEGGPEATLLAGTLSRVGSYETGFIENDDNHDQWALPNVIGLRPR
jgi:hypothetical protein